MLKESEYCFKVIETEFGCCICKKLYEEGEMTVKDYGHVTGKYPGSAHQECNLQ